MEIVKVKIEDLKPSEYNPREMSEKEAKDLKESIKRFGLVEPILVNKAKSRKNIIIGGHMRYWIAKEMKHKEISVVYVDIPDINKERELNLRLNKNVGHWDYGMLANFEEEMLLDAGFESDELMVNFGLNEVNEILLDRDRINVITVEAPESPRLKVRQSFYCDSIEEFNRINKFFDGKSGKLNKDKLLDLIK